MRAHTQLQKRWCIKANALNYSAAVNAGLSQGKEGETVKVSDYQPFEIEEDSDWFRADYCTDLLAMVKSEGIPVAIVADLENSGLLPRIREKLK